MLYDMIDKAYRGEYQVEYCITLAFSRFSDCYPTSDLHKIEDIRSKFHADVREEELEPG